MQLNELIDRIKRQPDQVNFKDVIRVIDTEYDYRPSAFSNGSEADCQVNPAGSNEGSCKIFAFAQLNGLDEAETLVCFGDHYRVDVLQNPQGTDHANIRSFMRHGWPGIRFDQFPLRTKKN